jgi:hypothetical protein
MKPETPTTKKEYILLGLSYILSKILQFRFKCNVYLFGLKEGDDDVTNDYSGKGFYRRWTWRNPFSGAITDNRFSSYYFNGVDWDKVGGRYLYGKFSHAIKAEFGVKKTMWLLELDHGKVQEIDVVEFLKSDNGKRGVYFSIYNNELSNKYYADPEETIPIYRRFQTRMRSKFIMNYLETKKVNYSIKWTKNYVMWYIDGLPVAVSFVYIPIQSMYIILSNII